MGPTGFTLIELMIVVAIIALIAAIAVPSLLRSRMAANQASGAAACKTFAEAEEIYRRTDYNRDGVLEYAARMKGANSLLETAAGAADLELVDEVLANAEGQPGAVRAKAGYVFTVLTQQGANAVGGTRNYIDATARMTLGFGVCASPASYDTSGRDTFISNKNGTIFQQDRGRIASQTHVTWFDPDTLWVPSE